MGLEDWDIWLPSVLSIAGTVALIGLICCCLRRFTRKLQVRQKAPFQSKDWDFASQQASNTNQINRNNHSFGVVNQLPNQLGNFNQFTRTRVIANYLLQILQGNEFHLVKSNTVHLNTLKFYDKICSSC